MWAGQMELLPGTSVAPTLYDLGDTVEEWAAEALTRSAADRLIVVDKRFLSNTELGGWYTPGTTPTVFGIEGYRFGCAICIEVQFAEFFAEYERLGVDAVLFASYVIRHSAPVSDRVAGACRPELCLDRRGHPRPGRGEGAHPRFSLIFRNKTDTIHVQQFRKSSPESRAVVGSVNLDRASTKIGNRFSLPDEIKACILRDLTHSDTYSEGTARKGERAHDPCPSSASSSSSKPSASRV
jgi:hypothetical protein